VNPDEYFLQITQLIASFTFVHSFSIEFDKRSPQLVFVRGSLYFIDESALFFREFIVFGPEITRVSYSYHYQDRDGNLIFRYDNAPHFPQLPNFPHHKHDGVQRQVVTSDPPDLEKILKEINEKIGFSPKTD
jgi:hypothetical protein